MSGREFTPSAVCRTRRSWRPSSSAWRRPRTSWQSSARCSPSWTRSWPAGSPPQRTPRRMLPVVKYIHPAPLLPRAEGPPHTAAPIWMCWMCVSFWHDAGFVQTSACTFGTLLMGGTIAGGRVGGGWAINLRGECGVRHHARRAAAAVPELRHSQPRHHPLRQVREP